MKNVNILSIIEAYRKLSNTLFQKLMNSYGIISGIKDYELNGIESFVNELLKIKNSITIVNNYYLGYSIPKCPVSGVWKVDGFPTTTAPIAKGNTMPPYCGKAVTWRLIQYA